MKRRTTTLFVAAALALLALGLPASAGTASASSPARVSVQVPQAAGGAGVVMLELAVTGTGLLAAGHIGAVVTLARAGGPAVEIGRFSILPSGGGGEQRYQFNIASALKRLGLAGGFAEVEVVLVDRGGGPPPSGVGLSIGQARIVTR